MTTTSLHPDLPTFDSDREHSSWDLPDPLGDIQTALEESGSPLTLRDISEITDFSVSYHGETWSQENDNGGTELSLFVLGRLKDGRWFALEAGNDYTGWGCQDYSDIEFGETREAAIRDGLTNDGRSALGIELA